MPTTVLGRLRFPSPDLSPRAELALRTVRDSEYSAQDGVVRVGPSGVVQFDTYLNAFGVGKWRRHGTANLVSLEVEVSGACVLELVHGQAGRSPVVVASREVDAGGPTEVQLALPALDNLGEGAAFLRIRGRGAPSTLLRAQWQTTDAPGRTARLGLVITTFNRPAQVGASVARLLTVLRQTSGYDDRLQILIVDNGRNLELDLDEEAPITVLPNDNTGGAGGFTRGLMHFRRQAEVTHVLFMDDDVSFDPEIVFRTIELLSFARDPLLCIAGAMLSEGETVEQFEAGAQFAGRAMYPSRPVGHGLDLLDWDDLLQAELEVERIDYGAWWYFAFPVTLTTENPIPAFIRGDDVCWGLLHAGAHTVTFNGIGLWHDNFECRNGPPTWFYETRNLALVSVLTVHDFGMRHLLWRYLNICGRNLLCFKYASAGHITGGMKEFLLGPDHWIALDQVGLNRRIANYDGERIGQLDEELLDVEELSSQEVDKSRASTVLSMLTLAGHVLPKRMHVAPMAAVPIQQRVITAATWRRAILYRSEQHGKGFVARRDRARFFKLLADMVVTSVRISYRFKGLRSSYRAAYPDMVSDEYWERQVNLRPGPSEAP